MKTIIRICVIAFSILPSTISNGQNDNTNLKHIEDTLSVETIKDDSLILKQKKDTIISIDSLSKKIVGIERQVSYLKKTNKRNHKNSRQDTVYIKSDGFDTQSVLSQYGMIDSGITEMKSQILLLEKQQNMITHSQWGIQTALFVVFFISIIAYALIFRAFKRINQAIKQTSLKIFDSNRKVDDVLNIIPLINEIKAHACEMTKDKEEIIQSINCHIDEELKKCQLETPRHDQSNDERAKPSLDSYNNSVFEFITINKQIASLRRKETKILLHGLFKLLAMREIDTSLLMKQIRECNISDNYKEQFVSLISQIKSFLAQKKPIIDSWLSFEPKDNVNSFLSGIRLPIGEPYDDSLDRDVLGDVLSGETIIWVYQLGYYFPGNTIQPYREKTVVSI